MPLARALKTRDPTRGAPWGAAPVLVATVVLRRGLTESAMTTTEDHGGAGRMPALPEQGATKSRGVEELEPGRRRRLRRPDGRRHLLRGPGPEPAAPPQTIAVLCHRRRHHMLNLVGAGGGR